MTEAGGTPLGAVAAPANRRDDGLLAATLDTLVVAGLLAARPVVRLEVADDDQPCRQALVGGVWACYRWHGRPRRRPGPHWRRPYVGCPGAALAWLIGK